MTLRETRIFLDTCTIKHACHQKPALVSKTKVVDWGDYQEEVEYNEIRTVSQLPQDNSKRELRREILLLEDISDFVRENSTVNLYTHTEVDIELMGITSFGAYDSFFDGINIKHVDSPFPYGRTISTWEDAISDEDKERERFIQFLERLDSPRFNEIQEVCRAYPEGEDASPDGNSLIDSFHIFCAEEGGCDYFLTTDFKLVRKVGQYEEVALKTEVVKPSQLLEDVKRFKHSGILSKILNIF